MKRRILIYTLLAALLTACSTTRRIPEGEQLYTGIKKMEFIGEKEAFPVKGFSIHSQLVLK